MRNRYIYEIGFKTGVNEAVKKQNDLMRAKIIAQNNLIQKLQERELESKEILKQMEKQLSAELNENDIRFDAPEIGTRINSLLD